MEQFRHVGEALGSLKAVIAFRENIQINQRQCCLLADVFSLAYNSITEEIRQNLKFGERQGKWKVLEQPLREMHKIFKEGEAYIRYCMETKNCFARAIDLYNNTDYVEFYIHNLLCCIPIVIEAIESAGEISGRDQDEMQRKRAINSNKYRKEYRDMKLFQWKFGTQYLISPNFCKRYDTAWKEDRWILLDKIREKKLSGSAKYENRLTDVFIKILEGSEAVEGKLLPRSILVGSKDYHVRRRLVNGSQCKEILWLGDSFVIRQFFGDIEALEPEISSLLSLAHPNIVENLLGFTDDEKKECTLLMEVKSRNLSTHINESAGARKRMPFTLPVAVDLMLQIARGMEYLHSKKIYHGELNPSNILVKPRGTFIEGYLHAKVSEFGLHSVNNLAQNGTSNQNGTGTGTGTLPLIWYAPEVLEEQEQEQTGTAEHSKYTEKSDVYSFGMVCFEFLTGKIPFEDSHLQGDKISRNIRAGERPLFPFHSPKYVTSLTKRCWHSDPNQRPSFSSICRILRYVKRFLAMNPDYNIHPDPPVPLVDYWDIESNLLRKFPWGSSDPLTISQIPFQMFAYLVIEKEKISSSSKDNSESGSDASVCGDELLTSGDDSLLSTNGRKSSVGSDSTDKRLSVPRRSLNLKSSKRPVAPRGRSVRPPQMTCGRSMKMNSESRMMTSSSRIRRTFSGHVLDSELC